MANLSFYAQEIDDILGRADKATAATALTSTDTLAGLTDGLYTATAEVASVISDSPVSVAFTLRVLADMYILILADGSDTYTGTPGSWHKSSSGEDTTARAAIAEHIADKSNPHEVTKEQLGLGNVDNVATKDVLAKIVDGGTKNLMQNIAKTTTLSGVTFTKNSNGSVTITGTATSSTGLRIVGVQGDNSYSAAKPLPRGKYVVYPSNTGSTLKRFGMGFFTDENAERVVTYIYDTPVEITIDNDTSRYDYTIAVSAGQVCDGETLYPMLCVKAAWDISQKYVPYRPSYDELVARIEALESGGN